MKEKLYLIVNKNGEPIHDSQGRLRTYRSLEQLKRYSYIFKNEYVKVFSLECMNSAKFMVDNIQMLEGDK